MIGEIISHYRITKQLGAGGMGVVYEAVDTKLDRTVALKFLPPESTRDPESKARFIQEAKAASALDHPNVCTIYEIGETDDGQLFIAMALYRGQDLKTRLAKQPLSVSEAVNIVKQVARGLAEVHANEIVHRDIKPANLIVLDTGPVKILDFGVAKLSGPSRLTRTGSTLGTMQYMSPEQVRGGEVDFASDIWSLGVVFYEMITGTTPFPGDHDAAVIYAIQNVEPVAPSRINPLIPATFDNCILKCLEKKPERRFPNMISFLDAVTAGERAALNERTSAGRKWRSGWGLGMLGLLLLILAFVSLDPIGVLRRDHGQERTLSGIPASPSSSIQLRQISVSGSAICPVWSPDGATIAYTDEGGVQVCSPGGGQPRTIPVEAEYALTWNWAPDSESILAHGLMIGSEKYAIWDVSIYGEPPRILTDEGVFGDMTSDGNSIVYAKLSRRDGYAGIVIRDLQSGEEQLIVEPDEPGKASYKPQWDPDLEHLAYIRWQGTGHEIWYCNRDGSESRKLDVEPMHVAGHYCFTPDGDWIVIAGEVGGLWSVWKVPVEGGTPVRLSDPNEYTYHVGISPTGDAIVFSRGRELGRIMVLDLESRGIVTPFRLSVAARNPVFGPTGEHLFFQALVNGVWQIWRGPSQGGGRVNPIVAVDKESCAEPRFDAEGHLFHVRSDMRPSGVFGDIGWKLELYRTGADGGGLVRVAAAGGKVSELGGSRMSKRGLLFTEFLEGEKIGLRLLQPDGTKRDLIEDNEGLSFQAYDWGRRDDEIIITHAISDENGTYPAISALNIDTGKRNLLVTRRDLAREGIDTGSNWGPIAVSDAGDFLIVVTTGAAMDQQLAFRYDLVDGGIKEEYRFSERGVVRECALDHRGERLAVSTYDLQTDVFLLEGLVP